MDDESSDLWLDPTQLAPCYITSSSPAGLYLLADAGFKRVWLVEGEQPTLVYLDHEFTFGVLGQGASLGALRIGPVRLAADPFAFVDQDRGRAGQLTFERGKIHLMVQSSQSAFGGRRLHVADIEGADDSYPYAAICSRWALLINDADDETRVAFEVDLRSGSS